MPYDKRGSVRRDVVGGGALKNSAYKKTKTFDRLLKRRKKTENKRHCEHLTKGGKMGKSRDDLLEIITAKGGRQNGAQWISGSRRHDHDREGTIED